MITFIKKNWILFLLGVVIIYLLFFVTGIIKDMLFNAGFAAAQEEYQMTINNLNTEIFKWKNILVLFSEKKERERQELKTKTENEINNINIVFETFKSESAETLRKKKSTIEEILKEKEKDEITIIEAKETIRLLGELNYATNLAWKLSDEEKDKIYGEIISKIELKYSKCQEWTTKLEAKIKPKLFSKIITGGVIVAAFVLGRGSK